MNTLRERRLFVLTELAVDFDHALAEIDVAPPEAVAFLVFRVGEQFRAPNGGVVKQEHDRTVASAIFGSIQIIQC